MEVFESISLAAPDGNPIAARFFHPVGASRGTVLVVPAMGVSQRFYTDFAGWLASRGLLTATFDYRGIGLSRNRDLRDLDLTILDWAEVDCSMVVDALTARAPDVPFYWIGHSLGGQILPFVPNRDRVAKMIAVATGSGYWLQNAWRLRVAVWWLWFVAVPVSTRVCGYFPGRRLRKVGDLPRGVIEQWRRWCLDPEYAVGVEGRRARELYDTLDIPVVSLSFTDDEYMSARSIASINALLGGADLTAKRIGPEDAGGMRIGHFGFFRRRFEQSLWEPILLPELSEANSSDHL